MDILEVLSTLMKVILVPAAYAAVLGLGIITAWWMSRRARRREGSHHD